MNADRNMPVLIVNNYIMMVRVMKTLLHKIGYPNVDAAATGTEALEKFRNNKYRLIISDWHIKPMTGYDLLMQIRAEETIEKTPFILITPERKREFYQAAHDAGVSIYLVKPFSAGILKQKIETILGSVSGFTAPR